MPKTQMMRAVDSSIRQWKKKLAIVKDGLGLIPISDDCGYAIGDKRIKVGIDSCPLCKLYYREEFDDCKGCPIFGKTKIEFCYGTPYEEVTFWLRKIDGEAPINEHVIAVFEKEVAFLTLLLKELQVQQQDKRDKRKIRRKRNVVSKAK